MSRIKLVLDTNIVIDFLNEREPFYDKARLLMTAGRVGEFDLWISASQVTDLIYILSEGGKASLIKEVSEQLQGLRTFVNVFPVSDREIDKMLSSSWKDPEDRLLFEVALTLKANCLVTRTQSDFESNLVPILNCDELFNWLKSNFDLDYEEVAL